MSDAAFCVWPNPVLSAAFALPAEPSGGYEEKKWLSRQLERVNARYVPSKAKDGFTEMRGIPRQLRLFLPVMVGHTFDAVTQKPISLRQLAEDLECTPRTIQNYIWKTEEMFPQGFKVTRQRGCPHRFRFTVQLLTQIGAIVSSRPKAESKPAPLPPAPAQIREAAKKAEDFSARYIRLLNEGKTREEALRELYRPSVPGQPKKQHESEPEDLPTFREALSTLVKCKSMLPSRAG